MTVLVALLIKPGMNSTLEDRCLELARNLEGDIAFHIDREPVIGRVTDATPWAKVARARNRVLEAQTWRKFSHILWVDADIVDYPPDLLTVLLQGNEDGMTAPLVLIEGSEVFYDWSAFILKGRAYVDPNNRQPVPGRNISTFPPYIWETQPIVDMDGVGSVVLVNTDIYRAGARYEDHPAFTDHFSVAEVCRSLGRRVTLDRRVTAYHADLPKYGEAWH